MVKKTARQFVRHSAAGIVPSAANLITYTLLALFDAVIGYQTVVAFAVGGQVAFWTHDRWSYRHRNPALAGWQYRWCWFMPGQIGGGVLNWYVAKRLTDTTDLWPIAVYAAATGAGVIITFTWTNCISHKDDSSITCPAEPAREHAQK